MTLAVTGRGSTIVQELERLIPAERIERIDVELGRPDAVLSNIVHADRYLLAAGILYSKHILAQSWVEMIESISVNLVNVIRICETILQRQDDARICVIGSESARAGSFDQTYAASKAAIHAYVMQRKTRPHQQLVCISPPIIADSGMTSRRHDFPQVLELRPHVYAIDVARVVKRALYDRNPDELTGCILTVQPNERTATNGKAKTD
jgi:NADP-dependent 3-hydroxy acid dehydrogenase YdfG